MPLADAGVEMRPTVQRDHTHVVDQLSQDDDMARRLRDEDIASACWQSVVKVPRRTEGGDAPACFVKASARPRHSPEVFTEPWTLSLPLFRQMEEQPRVLDYRRVESVRRPPHMG